MLRLQKYPNDPKFKQSKFWSLAQDRSGGVIMDGYKMKWHQVGCGKVQLRLTVGVFCNECILCEAYVKKDTKVDKRKLARFKVYLDLIRQGSHTTKGKLT